MMSMRSSYFAMSGLLALCAGCDAEHDGLVEQSTKQPLVAQVDAAGACTLPDQQPSLPTLNTLQLWSPNHKFHSIGVEDCVDLLRTCGDSLSARFTWASSDEPLDDIGDGHFAPDLVFDGCQRVEARAERQGPKDGRVYKLGVRVSDRAGHIADGTCHIIVNHDKRGRLAVESADAYRIDLTGTGGRPDCSAAPPAPPVVPAPVDGGRPTTLF
jgi:hypothetical protein